jgi:hypothetical protein
MAGAGDRSPAAFSHDSKDKENAHSLPGDSTMGAVSRRGRVDAKLGCGGCDPPYAVVIAGKTRANH